MTSTINFNIPFVMEGKIISVNDPDNWPAPTYYEEGCQDSIAVHDSNSLVFTEVDREDGMSISERKTRYLNFGDVVEGLKRNMRFAREGWNGKDMFIFLVSGSRFNVNRPPLNEIFPEGTEIDYRAHIDMRCADGDIVVWTAAQSDILANDWVLIEA